MVKPLADPDIARRLDELNKKAAATAEEIIFRTFPQKILDLNVIIESMNDTASPYNRSHMHATTDPTVYPSPSPSEPDTKKRKRAVESEETWIQENDVSHARFPGLVLANHHVKKLQDEVRNECEDLIELCDKVKLWVSLRMPMIEDECIVSINLESYMQIVPCEVETILVYKYKKLTRLLHLAPEVLSELHRSQESGYNLRDNPRTSYLNRAKICSKLIKYPNVEDYTLALREHDAKQVYMARQHLIDIKNIYSVLTDALHNNIQKIRAPRGNNRASLY